MKKLTTVISAIFMGLIVFCVPLMTVNAATHHDMNMGEAQFDCDESGNMSYSCCSTGAYDEEILNSPNRTSFKVSKLFEKIVVDNYSYYHLFEVKDNHVDFHDFRNEPVNFLTGTTIKRE